MKSAGTEGIASGLESVAPALRGIPARPVPPGYGPLRLPPEDAFFAHNFFIIKPSPIYAIFKKKSATTFPTRP